MSEFATLPSVVFPGAPAGILYPGDPGVGRSIAPPRQRIFTQARHSLLSGSGPWHIFRQAPGRRRKNSIRTGFGTYYTAIEALTVSVAAGNAPYGTTYTSPAPPLFNDPFVTASTGQNFGQPFPVSLAPLNVSRIHPDSAIDWSQYLPISGIPAYSAANKIPYSHQYMFSLQRQLGAERSPASVMSETRDIDNWSW